MRKIILSFVLLISLSAVSQENIFLKRDFWKTNPNIATINKHIAEGHNVSELNLNAFDGVVYAILENADNKSIKYLLSKKGNDVNKITHDGRTYLFWAAYKNNLDIMKHLFANGAKTDVIDTHGYTYMNFAAANGQTNPKFFDLCYEHGADINKERDHDGANALLLVAPSLKDTSLLDYFVKKGVDLKSGDEAGNGLFNYAARTGNKVVMEYAIKKGLPYKELNQEGGNAMIFASRGARRHTNSLDTYQYLENLGIDPNVTTKTGTTPLHSISYRGTDKAIYNYFISKGIDVNQPNADGNTALLNAARSNNLEMVTMLAGKTRDINFQNKAGHSALTNAVRRNKIDVVNFLLKNGAKTDVVDSKGNGLGYYLIQSYTSRDVDGFEAKAKALVSNGLKLNATQKDGNNLFHFGVDKFDVALLKWINGKDVDVNAKNSDGLTPLQKAAMSAKNADVLKYLISIGADKTVKTDFEESVYDLASENELLQKNNIDIQFLK